ncbi:MAG: STAS domain-containing protein [Acutalibacteraceae bacterium]|nr:STAS domain-containing protein [Clostridia bacterium]MEE3449806.1 STAS domain-containing protein [Acutalibacteraceae bacterium]
MNIKKTIKGKKMIIALDGKLDTNTAPQLEAAIREGEDSITVLEFDFANLQYMSSAGLRVLLSAQKIMNNQGEMIIRNVSGEIMDIFDITGFIDIFNIKK